MISLPSSISPSIPRALFPGQLDLERFADLIEPLDLAPGFFEVPFERTLQLGRARGLRHLRQRLDDLVLGAVDVLQLVNEQFFQRVRLFGHSLLLKIVSSCCGEVCKTGSGN